MASQPSVHSEERNLQRLRAWELRNQEASQAKEPQPENVPLFGEPYKTNKGDELSNRIQRMLGTYEDVNHPSPLAIERSPIPSYVTVSLSDQGQTHADKSTKAPFHHQLHNTSTPSQKCPSGSSHTSQPVTMAASSPPNGQRHPSAMSKVSSGHGHHGNSARQQESEAFSGVKERGGHPQETSAPSPGAKPPSLLHSCRSNGDTDGHEESSDHSAELAGASEVSAPNIKPSPRDAAPIQATKTNALPCQTFPPLLSSKQPSVVMTQKPTAYVRPIHGQDQVVSDSPELKPSPEPYAPLPELISKSNTGKMKTLPPFLEPKINEAQCVEDILREMTHSWPPLLPAIHTPGINELSKSLSSAKEAERVSSCPEQKVCVSSSSPPPAAPSLIIKSPLSPVEAAHSSGVESASSSDSESSSRSESDSESTTGEPPPTSSVKTEPDAPAVSRGDWQLGIWIDSQANVSKSRYCKRLQPTQRSKHSCAEVIDRTGDSKPTYANVRQKELGENKAKVEPGGEIHQGKHLQPGGQKCVSAHFRELSSKSPSSSKPAKDGCRDQSQAAAAGVKCEEVAVAVDKELRFSDRPRDEKKKAKHSKKSKEGDSKHESKRTSKHTSLDKQKAGTEVEVKQVPFPAQSPAAQSAPDQPAKIPRSKSKAEAAAAASSQKGNRKPHKTSSSSSTHSETTLKTAKDVHRPPQSLVVRIDLSLLSKVPQASGNLQEKPSNAKRPTLVVDGQDGDVSATHKRSKKSIDPIVEEDIKNLPRKKRRLENQNTSSAQASNKVEASSNPAEERERKKAKKNPAPAAPKDPSKESHKSHKCSSAETQDSGKDAVRSGDACKHKKRSVKHEEHPHSEKKPPKGCPAIPSSSSSQSNKEVPMNRPMLRLEDRQYPVKHYIKEAKRLKRKADAEPDKISKAFNYLDAAMYFVESGIAMEKDPQISLSSYTMFDETVELLKFVVKLKNRGDSCASPSDKDFIALCLKCQSLLQMTLFRQKYKTALKYSKTLADHFTTSAQATPDASACTPKATDAPTPDIMPSPASTSSSSGPGPGNGSVAVPRAIQQVAFTYINITTLFLSAHDLWEQAEVLANKGSGLLAALDRAMSPLSLTSTMNTMVRYTRQGLLWLRLDSAKVK